MDEFKYPKVEAVQVKSKEGLRCGVICKYAAEISCICNAYAGFKYDVDVWMYLSGGLYVFIKAFHYFIKKIIGNNGL